MGKRGESHGRRKRCSEIECSLDETVVIETRGEIGREEVVRRDTERGSQREEGIERET